MKNTKFFIAALLPAALWLGSCGDETVDNASLGRTLEFPEMSEHERGYANGEIFGNSLIALSDTIRSAKEKGVFETSVFYGMMTPPFSKIQRPYELYNQNVEDSLWLAGFKEGVEATAGLSADSEIHGKIMKEVLAEVSFSDLANCDLVNLSGRLEELLD